MAKLVRLKPYDRHRGHVLRRLHVRGQLFHEARGWYKVDDGVAEALSDIRQRDNNPNSPLAFDVCSEDEAVELEKAEKRAAEERASAVEPNVASAKDLTSDEVKPDAKPAEETTPSRRRTRRKPDDE